MAEEVGVDPNTGTSRTNRFQDGVASRRNSSSIKRGFSRFSTFTRFVLTYSPYCHMEQRPLTLVL